MNCTRPETREESVIEDCVELYIRPLEVYIHSSDERQIQAATGDEIDVTERAIILKAKKKKKVAELVGQILT